MENTLTIGDILSMNYIFLKNVYTHPIATEIFQQILNVIFFSILHLIPCLLECVF